MIDMMRFLPKLYSSNDKKFFLGVGHSHILGLRFAVLENETSLNKAGVGVNTIWLGDDLYKDFRVRSRVGIEGFTWSATLKKELSLRSRNSDLVFSCLGGNAYNILGLVKHAIPYDFILDDEPNLPRVPGSELIPMGLIEKALMGQGGYPETVWCLKALRKSYSGLIMHCESPPPIPNEDHLLKYAGPFETMFLQCGIAPSVLRYKLWRTYSKLIKNECDLLGIHFLASPTNMLDVDGFLIEKAWNKDATHANSIYGMAVIDQLISM